MIKKINKFKLYLIFLFSSFILPAQDFEVSPALISFKLNPNEIGTQKVLLTNHSDKKQSFELKMSDYSIDSLGNKLRMPPGTSKRSCANWISISPSLLELNPNETKQIDVTMTVPSDGFSSKWVLIYVQTSKEQSDFSKPDKAVATGVLISPRIVIQVFQSPSLNNNYMATIQKFKEITKKGDKERSFSVEISNVGDKLINAKVFLNLANTSTGIETKFNAETIKVLPDAKRQLVLKLPSDLPKGKFALAALLDYGHNTDIEGAQLIIDIK